MLKPAISDPVLIKPSFNEFITKWDTRKEDNPPTIAQMYGMYVTLADPYSSVDSKMGKIEREKRLRRLEFKLKRRNSVLLANFKEEVHRPGGMRRSWSCTELGATFCRETTSTKRVSFSVTGPAQTPGISGIKKLYSDLGPAKIHARPILVRKPTTYFHKNSLSHMDFDTFNAWRRGSKMSDDVEKFRMKGSKNKESITIGKMTKEEKNEEWWIVRMLKIGIESCLQRRRVTPTQEKLEDSSEGIVISIVNGS